MSNKNTIFAFFVRAEERGVALMIDTSSKDKWVNNIRRAVNMPDAEVHLVEEGEWKAPAIQTVDEDAKIYIPGIQDYFAAQHYPPMSNADFSRERLGDMKSAMTGLVVVLIKHSLN